MGVMWRPNQRVPSWEVIVSYFPGLAAQADPGTLLLQKVTARSDEAGNGNKERVCF